MEKLLFDWCEWEVLDTMVFLFTEPKLVVNIGPYEIGEVFEYATVDYGYGTLTLGKDGKICYKCKFGFALGEELPIESAYGEED
jgi:hypothetical protein